MSNASITSLILFLALSNGLLSSEAQAARAAGCSEYLKAASEYEELVDGLVVQKKSVFDLTDWSPNSDFEHILATDKVPAGAKLELQAEAKTAAKPGTKAPTVATAKTSVEFKKWDLDPKFRRADFSPQEYFKTAKGAASVVLQVKKGTDVLCTETRRISGGD